MKKLFLLSLVLICTYPMLAQKVVTLPFEKVEGVEYPNAEIRYFSEVWSTTAVTNVSEPSMIVYSPSSDKNNGASVVIAPGGGLYALSINSEGQDVAQWLVAKGFTAVVLKYRLVPSGEDGTREVGEKFQQDPPGTMQLVRQVLSYSVQDGLNAIKHLRENAAEYNLEPNKIGFMGFSAGGAVTMGVGYEYDEDSRPNFLVPVYAWTDAKPVETPPSDSPPVLVICATDDPLELATGSIELYNSYRKAGVSVGLHMYSKGGHGFGMRTQGLPSDSWIERFYDWAVVEKLVE